MRTLAALCLALACLGAAAAGAAPVAFARPGWAIGGLFPAEPRRDEFRAPTPQGEVISERFFVEDAGEAFLLVRSTYPVAFDRASRPGLFEQVKREAIAARPGDFVVDEPFTLGGYEGRRFVIEHRRAKRTKELRVVVVGGTLYAGSYERAAGRPASARAASFLDGLEVQPAFADFRAMEEAGRWREVTEGRFKVRYDATRWYRDPTDREPGVANFLRLDKRGEAQLIAEPVPHEGGSLEEVALAAAKESAESVQVRRRGTKRRGDLNVGELEFAVRFDGATYVNLGYFYNGAEGAVQFRAWALESDYRGVAGDLAELLDGLALTVPSR
ncbi:MAG TPA: hypothetical protein VEB66_15160 [Opitutaceae bacterium]|nr:hypothetical protein [Opitutaceae bacterium]